MTSIQYDPDTFGFLVTDIARLYRSETDRRIVEAGLEMSPAEARTLVHAARNGPVRQSALAEVMGIEAMTLSGHLDRLEGQGMIRRVADPDDRRAKQVHLTEEGADVLETIRGITTLVRNDVSDTLAAKEWDAINGVLKSIRNNLLVRARSTEKRTDAEMRSRLESDHKATQSVRFPAPVMSELRVGIVGGLLAAIGSMSMALYTPAMPEIVHAFGTTEALVKLTLSIYFAGFCFAQLICGPLSDGFGRRPITIAFMVIYLGASVLALFSPDINVLLAARFLQGVGAAVGVTVSRAIVRDLFTHESSARVMNLIGIVIAVGPAISPTLGGFTMEYFGWHAIFLVMVLLGVLVVLMALFIIKETVTRDLSRIRPGELVRAYGRLLGNRAFICCCLGVGGTTGALYTAATILPFILMARVGMSATHFGIGLLLQTGCYLVGGLLFRRLLSVSTPRRLAAIGYLAITMASIAIAVLLRLYEPTYLLVMAPMALFAFGIALVMPVMTSAGMEPFPKIAGAASALMGFFQMGGGLVGGAIAATMSDPVIAFATLIPALGFVATAAFVIWRLLPEAVVTTA